MKKKDRFDDYPLTPDELTKLCTFNAEKARGLVHFPGYAYEMAKLQAKVNDWTEKLEAVSREIDENYRKDLMKDARPSADDASVINPHAVTHTHIFDRLHGFCRCGARKVEDRG